MRDGWQNDKLRRPARIAAGDSRHGRRLSNAAGQQSIQRDACQKVVQQRAELNSLKQPDREPMERRHPEQEEDHWVLELQIVSYQDCRDPAAAETRPEHSQRPVPQEPARRWIEAVGITCRRVLGLGRFMDIVGGDRGDPFTRSTKPTMARLVPPEIVPISRDRFWTL